MENITGKLASVLTKLKPVIGNNNAFIGLDKIYNELLVESRNLLNSNIRVVVAGMQVNITQ